MRIEELTNGFFEEVKAGEIEIYNEFSLQHEFGIHLRKHFQNSKVQFERNVAHFKLQKSDFEKKEIDITITSADLSKYLCAIELKYPRNGKVPEEMFSFCKDITFLEQLVSSGFRSAYFLAVVDDYLFYSDSRSSEGIYGFFRGNRPISGVISKPTGAKDRTVTICGSYKAVWLPISDQTKYCLIQIHSQTSQPQSNAGRDTNS
jgi:hypothetical protein